MNRAPTPRGQVVLAGAAVAALVLVQVTWVSALGTPLAVPDAVSAAVLATGVARGPVPGAALGLWAGVLLDLVPPAAGPLGGWTLVLGCAGAIAGRAAAALRPGPFASLALVALGSGMVVLARAGTLWFAGEPVRADVLGTAAAAVGYALLLAPLALLVVTQRMPRATAPVRTLPPEVAAP